MVNPITHAALEDSSGDFIHFTENIMAMYRQIQLFIVDVETTNEISNTQNNEGNRTKESRRSVIGCLPAI